MSLQSRRAFVSYSRKNKDFVEKLVSRLQNRCTVWWDQRLTPAEVWWTKILKEIELCDCFVLILTEPYTMSVFCLTELKYAQQLGKPILPVVPDKAVKFPLNVAHSQAAMIDGFNVAEAYGEIIAGVSGIEPNGNQRIDKSNRPTEPTPTGQAQLSDIFADAAETEANGNFSLAERFYQQVADARVGTLSQQANKRLTALQQLRRCQSDYENIRKLAEHPATLSAAVDLWQVYVENGCAERHDPHSFATDARFRIKRLTSAELLPAPFEWIPIPAGKVTLVYGRSFGKKGEKETFYVSAFKIAKYPVTNAQYGLFIAAGGYLERRWWTDEGWQSYKWTEPRYWQDKQWNGAEHPVVGVSWFEAIAYCKWLSEVTSEKIMLPTELQWQRAAQGNDDRAYPWGNHWDGERCNNSVSPCNSNETTPVCQYEGKGDSPFGVVDMAGNIWEWCLTATKSGSNELSGTDGRVSRGGSWDESTYTLFRCMFRNGSNPSNGSNNSRGFRLALF